MKLEPRKIKSNTDFDNYFINDVQIRDMTQEVISNIEQGINAQREIVIKKKLKEILNIEIDFKEELKRRFKRFCCVRIGDEEIIYFNDGSIDGKRIVTFVKIDIPFDSDKFSIGYEETYY